MRHSRPPAGCEPRNHDVHFCGELPVLARNVASFFREGLRLGEAGLIVARPDHRQAFEEALRADGQDVAALVAGERLTMLDAQETLARFMGDAEPDWTRFEEAVGGMVRRLREKGAGLRVYGEMVDLLWKDGKPDAAIRLEDLWNRLLQRTTFTLYCNYGFDLLDSNVLAGDLETVLSRHSGVHPARPAPVLERAVEQALVDVLGAEASEALKPLIRATQYPRPVGSGPEAALLWVRRHLPVQAGQILARARGLYEAAEAAAP